MYHLYFAFCYSRLFSSFLLGRLGVFLENFLTDSRSSPVIAILTKYKAASACHCLRHAAVHDTKDTWASY
jgi:hypothetical protein